MLSRGEAKGVFQCESSGFRELLTKLKPDCFEDMIAAVAMYRPGPLGAGLVETYINCKHGRETPSYLHPRIEPILEETHGLILYQEQVQALAGELAHFTLSEGDLMRRAMGKKIPELMEQYRAQFVEQADDTIGRDIAEKVFDQIDYFAGYGFNKSHSACYGLIAYQTAYLKCHHPVEYMAALLTTNRHNTDKVVEYREDARAMGIEVLPPDINDSDAYFTPAGESIRFGLSAVKGVGDRAVEAVQAERAENGPFKGLHDFAERIDAKLLNKGAVEALIKAGAFDRLGGHRAQFMAALEGALAAGASARQDRASGQMGLFGGGGEEAPEPPLPDVPPWPEPELLRREKEVLGFWVSNHPLARQAGRLRAFGSHTTQDLRDADDGAAVTLGGVITEIRLRTDRNDNRYAQLVLSDVEGAVTVWVFNRVFEETRELLAEDAVVFIRGRADRRRDEPTVMAEEVIPMEEAEARLTRCVVLNLDGGLLDEEPLGRIRSVVEAHRGEVPLLVRLRTGKGDTVLVRAGRGCAVRPGPELMQAMREAVGEGRLAFSGRSWN
jgi:DNA polymerase-3 subunit alpha